MRFALILVGALIGCGDDVASPDAPVDATQVDTPAADAAIDASVDARPVSCDAGDRATTVRIGPLLELSLLSAPDPTRPFNHTFEPSIAVKNGHVVVAAINIHLLSADSFTIEMNDAGMEIQEKRVASYASHDNGATFGSAVDPAHEAPTLTTDPVVRVMADGTFVLARLGQDLNGVSPCSLVKSMDHGNTWSSIVDGISCGDKEWIAIDDASQTIFGVGSAGFWRYSLTGMALGTSNNGFQGVNGYFDAAGAHFIGVRQLSQVTSVWLWNGTSTAAQEGGDLPVGDLNQVETQSCAGLGPTNDGGQWIVRAIKDDNGARIVLRVRHLPGDEGVDVPVSSPGDFAFFPAAAMDSAGRLHVIWYDTSGSSGVLKYAHTLSCGLVDGFTSPTVVDPAAGPGGNFYPFFNTPMGGRRFREYIDIAIEGSRAFLAWTHAPGPPSRVYTSYVDFD